MVGVNQYKGKHELQPWSIFPDNLWREDGQTIVKEEEGRRQLSTTRVVPR